MLEKVEPSGKKKLVVPQILVLITGLIVFFCLLSYFLPGGEYQLDENKRAIAGCGRRFWPSTRA